MIILSLAAYLWFLICSTDNITASSSSHYGYSPTEIDDVRPTIQYTENPMKEEIQDNQSLLGYNWHYASKPKVNLQSSPTVLDSKITISTLVPSVTSTEVTYNVAPSSPYTPSTNFTNIAAKVADALVNIANRVASSEGVKRVTLNVSTKAANNVSSTVTDDGSTNVVNKATNTTNTTNTVTANTTRTSTTNTIRTVTTNTTSTVTTNTTGNVGIKVTSTITANITESVPSSLTTSDSILSEKNNISEGQLSTASSISPLSCVVRGLAVDMDATLTANLTAAKESNVPTFLKCRERCAIKNVNNLSSCQYFSYHFKEQVCTFLSSTIKPKFIVSAWSALSPLECSSSRAHVSPKIGVWYTTRVSIAMVKTNTFWDCQEACIQRSGCGSANYDLEERHCNLIYPFASVHPIKVLYSDKFISLSPSYNTPGQCLIEVPKHGSYTWASPNLTATEPLISESSPSAYPTSTSVEPYTIATFKCHNPLHRLIPERPYQFCQPDASITDMTPICAPRNRRVVVLTDPKLTTNIVEQSYGYMLRQLFLTTEIEKYPNERPLRDYLHESSVFIVPAAANERGARFVDRIRENPSDVEALKQFVEKGGFLLVFHTNRQLIATVFDWTWPKGYLCQENDYQRLTNTISAPQNFVYEKAFGFSLDEAVSVGKINASSLLSCNNFETSQPLSPLFSVPQGEGVIAVLGLDLAEGAGYGRDNWAQTVVQTIVEFSKAPVLLSNTNITASDRCKIFGGLPRASTTGGSTPCCSRECPVDDEICCPPNLRSCSETHIPCLAEAVESPDLLLCQEQKSFYFNSISLRKDSNKRLQCSDVTPAIGLVNGTLLETATAECTPSGDLTIAVKFSGRIQNKISTSIHSIICFSPEPKALILGEREPINLAEVLKFLTQKKQAMQTKKIVSSQLSQSIEYFMDLSVETNVVVVPPEFYGLEFDMDVIIQLREFAARGGLIVDFSGEVFKSLIFKSVHNTIHHEEKPQENNWNALEQRILSGFMNDNRFKTDNKLRGMERCDPTQYVTRPNNWVSILYKALKSTNRDQSTTALSTYIRGLSKTVLEGILLNAVEAIQEEGESIKVDLSPGNLIPPVFSLGSNTTIETSLRPESHSHENSDLVAPLIICSSSSKKTLFLAAVATVGKGVVYADILLPQLLQAFDTTDSNTMNLPSGYSDIVARFLAVTQTFSPVVSFPFNLPFVVPLPSSSNSPAVPSPLPERPCANGDCNGTDASTIEPPEKLPKDEAQSLGLVIGAAAGAVLISGCLATGGYFIIKHKNKKMQNGREGSLSEESNYSFEDDHNNPVPEPQILEQRALTGESGFHTTGELSRRHQSSRVNSFNTAVWDARRAGAVSNSKQILGFPGVVNSDTLVDGGAISGCYAPTDHQLAPFAESISTPSSNEAVAGEIARLKTEMALLQLQMDNFQYLGRTQRNVEPPSTKATQSTTLTGNTGNIDNLPQLRSISEPPNEPLDSSQFGAHMAITPSTLEFARSPSTAQTVRLLDLDLEPLRSGTNSSLFTDDLSFNPELMADEEISPQNGENQETVQQGTRFAPKKNQRRRSSGFASKPQTSVKKTLKGSF